MLAIHDQLTRQMRDRLQTTCMGLGLVRLLQDARRFDEARTTLYSLENGVQNVESAKPNQKPSNRLKRISRSRSSGSMRIDAA
jgi:hypothetical protein